MLPLLNIVDTQRFLPSYNAHQRPALSEICLRDKTLPIRKQYPVPIGLSITFRMTLETSPIKNTSAPVPNSGNPVAEASCYGKGLDPLLQMALLPKIPQFSTSSSSPRMVFVSFNVHRSSLMLFCFSWEVYHEPDNPPHRHRTNVSFVSSRETNDHLCVLLERSLTCRLSMGQYTPYPLHSLFCTGYPLFHENRQSPYAGQTPLSHWKYNSIVVQNVNIHSQPNPTKSVGPAQSTDEPPSISKAPPLLVLSCQDLVVPSCHTFPFIL